MGKCFIEQSHILGSMNITHDKISSTCITVKSSISRKVSLDIINTLVFTPLKLRDTQVGGATMQDWTAFISCEEIARPAN